MFFLFIYKNHLKNIYNSCLPSHSRLYPSPMLSKHNSYILLCTREPNQCFGGSRFKWGGSRGWGFSRGYGMDGWYMATLITGRKGNAPFPPLPSTSPHPTCPTHHPQTISCPHTHPTTHSCSHPAVSSPTPLPLYNPPPLALP